MTIIKTKDGCPSCGERERDVRSRSDPGRARKVVPPEGVTVKRNTRKSTAKIPAIRARAPRIQFTVFEDGRTLQGEGTLAWIDGPVSVTSHQVMGGKYVGNITLEIQLTKPLTAMMLNSGE